MTRKDYEDLAKAIKGSWIKSQKPELQWHIDFQFRRTAVRIADVLERDNPRFDRKKFLVACDAPPLEMKENV